MTRQRGKEKEKVSPSALCAASAPVCVYASLCNCRRVGRDGGGVGVVVGSMGEVAAGPLWAAGLWLPAHLFTLTAPRRRRSAQARATSGLGCLFTFY